MDIPDIRISGGDIDIIRIPFTPDYLLEPPQALQVPVPITNQIGVPIVDIPGCVEAHEVNENNMLEGDDPKGVKVYCDGQTPSFNPIDYNADELQFSGEAQVPPVKAPESPEVKSPEVPKKINTVEVKCPTEAQEAKEPVGTYVQGYRKKVVEYKLVGNECIQITEAVGIPQQVIAGLPSGGQVAQVGGIAVIATTSALLAKPLADLLLKVVKPTVKKVIKKIAAIRGKTVKRLSTSERINEQRTRNRAIMLLRQTLKPKK
tara:strand:- start:2190 stop:2972 length:783 start_codon:yes stop_codon:yes gene_type:complete